MVQLSRLYMTNGITTALTIWTFVGKVMSLLFNILSRFVIAFLPRSKCLLILWLQSSSAVILETRNIKSVTVSTFSSFQFIRLFVSDSLRLHGLQHTRLPCPSSTPGACSNIFIELVMTSNHLILCHPLLLLHSMFPSISVFSNELGLCIRWLWWKDWSFSFNISASIEYSGSISFTVDWFDLLAVQGPSRVFSNTWLKSTNSSVLSFLYGASLTPTRDYWKNHNFD